ncbi:dynein regulatory complex subunit 4-like isoform X2 [Hemibagrus wyckioides]|uniref:dynein regulatory complex subunit 4-like isoform X2 n=1 Tax=Hemibagrus wyckioides TaxID=337641 RepID=UPI00266C3002|nr:dynein regulatory complex subunit 4-like isoform X2 [Hemibagrus wyckioides]
MPPKKDTKSVKGKSVTAVNGLSSKKEQPPKKDTKSVKGKSVTVVNGLSSKKEQPPKKDTKSVKGKSVTAVNGLSSEKEQLEEQIIQLRVELEQEREQSDYYQHERDKIHAIWEVTKSQLEEKKAVIRIREHELEVAEERHQAEIKMYEKKEKCLLYEQQNRLTELKAEEVAATKLREKEQTDLENELRRGMRSLKMQLKEQKSSYENYIKNLKLSHDKELTKLRNEFEERVQVIKAACANDLKKQRQEQDLRQKTELHEIKQRKSAHSNTLIKNHEKAFTDMKNFYSDITRRNVDQISSLQEQVEEMKKNEMILKSEMAAVRKENKRLTGQQKATEEVSELKKQLAIYKQDKALQARARTHLKVLEKEVKDLKYHNEVLEQLLNEMQQERDELNQNCNKAILEVQQKSSFKNLLLERKLDTLTDLMEKKDAQLDEARRMNTLVERMKADIQKGCDFLNHPKMLKDHYKKLQSYILEEENVQQMLINSIPGDVTEEIPTGVHRCGQATAHRNAKEKLDKRRGQPRLSGVVRLPPI